MSSADRGNMDFLGSTSTDVMTSQNELGDRYLLESSILAFFHRMRENSRQTACKDRSETGYLSHTAGYQEMGTRYLNMFDLTFSDFNTTMD